MSHDTLVDLIGLDALATIALGVFLALNAPNWKAGVVVAIAGTVAFTVDLALCVIDVKCAFQEPSRVWVTPARVH